jgi:hypothetical protein
LLEDTPKIKDHTETDWAKQEDATSSDLSPIFIMEGIHHRWVSFFRKLSITQMERANLNPEGSKGYPIYFGASDTQMAPYASS